MKHFIHWFQNRPVISYYERVKVASLAGVALFLTAYTGYHLIEPAGFISLIASMGATAVILFAVPDSPMAHPWATAGGHFVSGFVGIVCSQLIGTTELAAAMALSAAIFLMYQARCLHPPGGATALIPVLGGEGVKALGFGFLLMPLLLNVLVMLLCAQLAKRLTATKTPVPAPVSAAATGLSGLEAGDLQAALAKFDSFVDVSGEELQKIYTLAAHHALQREFGELRCADVMLKDLTAVEFGDELAAVWRIMQLHPLHALPVVDRARHVIGIVTPADFFREAASNQSSDRFNDSLKRLLQRTPTVTATKPEVAGQLMTKPVLTARTDELLIDVALQLAERGIRQIPVVDEQNKLAGMLAQADLLAALYCQCHLRPGLKMDI